MVSYLRPTFSAHAGAKMSHETFAAVLHVLMRQRMRSKERLVNTCSRSKHQLCYTLTRLFHVGRVRDSDLADYNTAHSHFKWNFISPLCILAGAWLSRENSTDGLLPRLVEGLQETGYVRALTTPPFLRTWEGMQFP